MKTKKFTNMGVAYLNNYKVFSQTICHHNSGIFTVFIFNHPQSTGV